MNILKKTSNFFGEVRSEMQKVTWPTREELIASTAIVLTTMAILSSFIGIVDFVMSFLTAVFLR